MRYGGLKRSFPVVVEKMLIQELKYLAEYKLVSKNNTRKFLQDRNTV